MGWSQPFVSLVEEADDVEGEVEEVVNGSKGISPGLAIRLGMLFGTSAEYWTHLQMTHELLHARRRFKESEAIIEPLGNWHSPFFLEESED